jgi:hypothetical protein
MSSGRQVLGLVQRSLAEAQARTAELDARLAEAQARLVELDAARARELQALARWRVAQLAAPQGLVARLVDAEAQARALLDRRDAEATALQKRLAAAGARTAELAAERTAAADALEGAADALDAAEAATQARLADDPAFLARRDAVRDAERVAVHADEKASASEAELEAKGRAYRDDPLFDYLWRRGYGTTAYRAGPIVRWLDGKVARLVRYADARPNYARLLDLPVQLRAHADRVGAEADAALAALRQLEEDARAADGIPALVEARAQAEARLVEVDGRIEAAASERRATLEAYETVVAGEDPHTREAVAFLASEFGREDLQALRRAALATPMPEDDAIVARLLDLERERTAAASAARELKEVATRDRGRATDLEELRKRFTGKGFDRPGTTFADPTLIGTLLVQLLNGAVTRDALWRILEQQRRYTPPRSDPTFGSGGFGRGTPWGGGGSFPSGGFGGTGRAGGGGFKPSGGGFKPGGSVGGGGFRTGGSVGGKGGFRTGGKF